MSEAQPQEEEEAEEEAPASSEEAHSSTDANLSSSAEQSADAQVEPSPVESMEESANSSEVMSNDQVEATAERKEEEEQEEEDDEDEQKVKEDDATAIEPPKSHTPVMIGLLGAEFLRSALSKGAPLQVISEFQTLNRLNGNTITDTSLLSFKLLDLHDQSRSTVHRSILGRLRTELLTAVRQLAQDQTATQRATSQRTTHTTSAGTSANAADSADSSEGSKQQKQQKQKGVVHLGDHLPEATEQVLALLTASFPYIAFEELQQIPITIMELFNVPATYLMQLATNDSLSHTCPLSINRRIWEVHDDHFRRAVFPLLEAYLSSSEVSAFSPLWHETQAKSQPKTRRRSSQTIQKLVEMVGESSLLYGKIVHYLRTLYVSTKNPIFCALRSDILMAFHDIGLDAIYSTDTCHNIAWCLDACIRDDKVDVRQIAELRTYALSLEAGDRVTGDLAMIVANPLAMNVLTKALYSSLEACLEEKVLPSTNADVDILSRLIRLGLESSLMLERESFKLPPSNLGGMMTRSLAALTAFLVDVRLHELVAQRPEAFELIGELPPLQLSKTLCLRLSNDLVARKVFLYYLLSCIAESKTFVIEVCTTYLQSSLNLVLGDLPFVQSLIEMVRGIQNHRLQSIVRHDLLSYYGANPLILERMIKCGLVDENTISRDDDETEEQDDKATGVDDEGVQMQDATNVEG